MRLGKYDVVIDQQNSTASRLITILSGANIKVGWKGKRWESHLNAIAIQPNRKYYAAERNIAMAQAIGIKNAAVSMLFTINSNSKTFVDSFLNTKGITHKKFFTVAPGSKDPHKKWYCEGYIKLCKLIVERYNQPIVILYAPYEYDDALAVARSHPEYVYLAPETTLNQAVAFVEASRVFICNDCALNHLSTATTTAAVGIFGYSSPELWSPALSFSKHRHLFNTHWVKGSSNDFGITPTDVIACIHNLINDTGVVT